MNNIYFRYLTSCTILTRWSTQSEVGMPSSSEAFKKRLAYSVTVRISAENIFMLLIKNLS